MDLNSGRFVEHENPLPSKQSLYHMTDPQWMEGHLKDDLALELYAYCSGYATELDPKDRAKIGKLAAWLYFPFSWDLPPQARGG
jgi:hypothetical protein